MLRLFIPSLNGSEVHGCGNAYHRRERRDPVETFRARKRGLFASGCYALSPNRLNCSNSSLCAVSGRTGKSAATKRTGGPVSRNLFFPISTVMGVIKLLGIVT